MVLAHRCILAQTRAPLGDLLALHRRSEQLDHMHTVTAAIPTGDLQVSRIVVFPWYITIVTPLLFHQLRLPARSIHTRNSSSSSHSSRFLVNRATFRLPARDLGNHSRQALRRWRQIRATGVARCRVLAQPTAAQVRSRGIVTEVLGVLVPLQLVSVLRVVGGVEAASIPIPMIRPDSCLQTSSVSTLYVCLFIRSMRLTVSLVVTGTPWELDQLPRQAYLNPEDARFGQPPVRKRRAPKGKDSGLDSVNKLDTINEWPHQKSPLGLGQQRSDAATSTTDLDRLARDGGVNNEDEANGASPRKVQKGQINALAKMLSALRR